MTEPQTVRYRGRHLPMVAVVIAATIATALAYSGMVLFGLEVAGMEPIEAYGLAGFLEISLVAVALMARNAALEGRPYGVLLTLTWVLSGTSGMFAALHQIAVPDANTPYMVAFRFVPPLVAALMWHLALVGERHLVTGHTLEERRREHRVHQYVSALELWRDAQRDSTGDNGSLRKIRAAHRRQLTARDSALRTLNVEDFEHRMEVWVERLEAAEKHGARLDQIGASSAKRGIAAHTDVDLPVVGRAPAATLAQTWSEAAAEAAVVAEATEVVAEAAAHEAAEAFDAEFEEAFEEAIAEQRAAEPQSVEQVTPQAQPAALAPTSEPLPETGHTRRVEVLDLVAAQQAQLDADGAAQAERSAFFAAYRTPAYTGATPVVAPKTPEPAEVTAARELTTEERDRRILELHAEGLNQRQISEKVLASRAVVSRVLKAATSA